MRDADFYQEHRDDPDEWSEPEEPTERVERRRLAAMVSVRLSPEESSLLRSVAAARNLSLSGFIRQAALAAVRPQVPSPSFDGLALAERREQTMSTSAQPTLRSRPAAVTTTV